MKKSGLADSPFFSTTVVKPVKPTPNTAVGKNNKPSKSPARKTRIDGEHGTAIPRYHDTTLPRYHDTIVEAIRKGVKDFGKEAATHRFTLDEKKALADIIYTYKSRGVRTSENEIARIAVNFMVEDFKANGEESVLHKVLKALKD